MPLQDGAINQILSFAAGVASPNIQPLEEYAADPARQGGNESGLARSPFMNRTWRQSAHMAAGLAQFIANRFEAGVLDDGNLDAIELGMATAVGISMRWNATVTYDVPYMVFGANGKLYTALAPSGPGVAGVGAKNPTVAANAAYWLDYAASITPPPAIPYELCTTVYSRLCVVSKPGFVPVNGTLIANAVNLYPAAWAYLQTAEGQQMCVSESAWQALVRATWHTNADGTKVGWDGVGGAAKYVIDLNAGTIRTPDLRGMTDEVDGYDSLGVGGVRGDEERLTIGHFEYVYGGAGAATTSTGPFTNVFVSAEGAPPVGYGQVNLIATFNNALTNPVGPRNHGPRYISDARVYLGQPAL